MSNVSPLTTCNPRGLLAFVLVFLLGYLVALLTLPSSINGGGSSLLVWSSSSSSARNASRFLNSSASGATKQQQQQLPQRKPQQPQHRPLSELCANIAPDALMPILCAVRRRRPTYLDMNEVSTQDQNKEPDYPRNPQRYCELALMHAGHCRDDETATQCIQRVSALTLERVIAVRCGNSSWFQDFAKIEIDSLGADEVARRRNTVISGGKILDALALPDKSRDELQQQQPGENRSSSSSASSMIPPSQRPMPFIYHKQRFMKVPQCPWIYRLPTGVPEEMIVDKVERNKLFDFDPLLPPNFAGANRVYHFGRHDEAISAELYSRSYFAWDHRRGGWSSQRHLEILAAGCVPFFVDLPLYCRDPRICLPGYPANLIRKAMQMSGVRYLHFDLMKARDWNDTVMTRYYEQPVHYVGSPRINFKRPGEIRWKEFNEQRYFQLADQLLSFTKKHLTTKAMASYWLKIMGNEEPKGYVFVTSHFFLWESLSLVHGLAALGVKVINPDHHVVRKLRVNATEEEKTKARGFFWKGHRGSGYTFGFRAYAKNIYNCAPPEALDGRRSMWEMEVDCLQLMKNGSIDLFSYNVHGHDTEPHFHWWNEYVRDNIPAHRVAFVDSSDFADSFSAVPSRFSDACAKGYKLFARDAPYPPDPVPPKFERIW